MTKATPQVIVKDGPEPNPILTMIAPGRRALGESWSKVTFTWDSDERAYVVNREDAEAPADNRAIVVPALGNCSPEMVNFILGQQMKQAEYRESAEVKTREQRRKEAWEQVNQMWLEYVEQKLKWLRGQTTIGPGGFNQREKA
jgi:hypothetical protein